MYVLCKKNNTILTRLYAYVILLFSCSSFGCLGRCVWPCVIVYVLIAVFISVRFEEVVSPGCGFCHIPYDELNIPFPAQLTYCYCCRRYKVPDILFTTIDMPTEANVTGKGCLIQARYYMHRASCRNGILLCCVLHSIKKIVYETIFSM